MIYAILNALLPQMWDEGWSDPLQVVAFVGAVVIFIFLVKGAGSFIDRAIFKAIDRIPSSKPMTDEEQFELFQGVDRNPATEDSRWAKNLSIVFIVVSAALALYVIVGTDWAAWYEERKYFIWFILTFAAFLASASIGAWIDKKGKWVSIPIFLLIVGAVAFVFSFAG
jgi:hypothetical protein